MTVDFTQNFISNILNFEPASDIDESNEINPESSTSCDDVIDKSDEQVSIVSLNTTTTEDDPELTCYFAEPNDKERYYNSMTSAFMNVTIFQVLLSILPAMLLVSIVLPSNFLQKATYTNSISSTGAECHIDCNLVC